MVKRKPPYLLFNISKFCFKSEKRPDLLTPNMQGIDMLLKLDSASFQYDKIYDIIQKKTNPILIFQSLLVLMLYMILKN